MFLADAGSDQSDEESEDSQEVASHSGGEDLEAEQAGTCHLAFSCRSLQASVNTSVQYNHLNNSRNTLLQNHLWLPADDEGPTAHRLEDLSEDDFDSNAETSSPEDAEAKEKLADQKK